MQSFPWSKEMPDQVAQKHDGLKLECMKLLMPAVYNALTKDGATNMLDCTVNKAPYSSHGGTAVVYCIGILGKIFGAEKDMAKVKEMRLA
jgi:hypothetical protein